MIRLEILSKKAIIKEAALRSVPPSILPSIDLTIKRQPQTELLRTESLLLKSFRIVLLPMPTGQAGGPGPFSGARQRAFHPSTASQPVSPLSNPKPGLVTSSLPSFHFQFENKSKLQHPVVD